MVDLLTINRGAVTAPAGCGKTYLIADALKRHRETKPILVLTHTNAGVAALRGRLDAFGVPTTRYRLATLDGWAMRLAATFPMRSQINPAAMRLGNPGADYPAVRNAATTLLAAGHVSDVMGASYAQLIVDEYQDCSQRQHAMVTWLAQTLPTCVLGDPLQAIFGFGSDDLPGWDADVCSYFPVVAQLTQPWRWINAEAADLGNWLLQVRASIVARQQVDVRTAPAGRVDWVQLTGANDLAARVAAASIPAKANEKVLIIGFSRWPAQQRGMASRVPGAIVVEAVDLKDLVTFGGSFEPTSGTALVEMACFADELMSGAGAVQVAANMMTGHAGIFAGGDMVPSERTVTVGVGHGKKAARHIDTWLKGEAYQAPRKHEVVSFDQLNTWYYSDAPKTVRPMLETARRSSTFDEVVSGLDETTALFEARRCLSCGNCFECDNCYGVCPDNAVIKLGPGKRFEFNLDYCKGCGICVAECPCGAIKMVPETS